ncbi:c-type cytochrome [Undibacterium sp. SXout20W]|uniref:c-type cytochrome n=1 Tax=Undibacterium sp. SXout20W TaxID=3413051 RepID=UPI003BF3199D
MLRTLIVAACAAIALAACTPKPVIPTAEQISAAETALPADPQVAAIYKRSCISCHTAVSSTAPIVGFAPAWQPRLEQGMAVLVQHARDGYKAMPAKGFCSDCSDQDLRSLIEFMSTPIPTSKEKS